MTPTYFVLSKAGEAWKLEGQPTSDQVEAQHLRAELLTGDEPPEKVVVAVVIVE